MRKVLGMMAALATAVVYADAPQRVVSTAGNASQIVAGLGLADRLVAVDTTSLLPAEVMADKPKIGYRRQLSAEGILAMAPDLVILAPDAGPPTAVTQLKDAGVAIFDLEDAQTLDGINRDITRLGAVLEADAAATALVAEQEREAQALAQAKAEYPRTPAVVFLLDTGGGGGVFGLGHNSAGEHMAAILGAELSLDFSGMKPLSNEVLATNNADVVLLAARQDAADSTLIKPLSAGRYAALDLHPAMQRHCVFEVNIMKSLGFGPGTAGVAREIAKVITPCIKGKSKG